MGLFCLKRKFTSDEVDLMKYNMVFELAQFYDKEKIAEEISKKKNVIHGRKRLEDENFERYLLSYDEYVKDNYLRKYEGFRVEKEKNQKELKELEVRYDAFDKECHRLVENYADVISTQRALDRLDENRDIFYLSIFFSKCKSLPKHKYVKQKYERLSKFLMFCTVSVTLLLCSLLFAFVHMMATGQLVGS